MRGKRGLGPQTGTPDWQVATFTVVGITKYCPNKFPAWMRDRLVRPGTDLRGCCGRCGAALSHEARSRRGRA